MLQIFVYLSFKKNKINKYLLLWIQHKIARFSVNISSESINWIDKNINFYNATFIFYVWME